MSHLHRTYNNNSLDHSPISLFNLSTCQPYQNLYSALSDSAHRTEYLTRTTALMHQYAESGNLTALMGLFDHPRAAFVLNISHQNTESGSTILHAACKRKDLAMVQWALDQGIDTLLRDKKKKTAADVTKDSTIKNLLRDSRSQGKHLAFDSLPNTIHFAFHSKQDKHLCGSIALTRTLLLWYWL